MARLGFRHSTNDRSRRLRRRVERGHLAERCLDFGKMLHLEPVPSEARGPDRRHTMERDHGISAVADLKLIADADPRSRPRIRSGEGPPDHRNAHRTFGAMLAGEVARKAWRAGPAETPSSSSSRAPRADRSARVRGARHDDHLEGDANDYVGKGLSAACSPCVRRAGRPSWPPTTWSSATPCSTAPPAVAPVLRRSRRRALRGACNGSVHRRRGRGRPWLPLHDRWRRRHCWDRRNNFGAGMSGSVAFVSDETIQFIARCNKGHGRDRDLKRRTSGS